MSLPALRLPVLGLCLALSLAACGSELRNAGDAADTSGPVDTEPLDTAAPDTAAPDTGLAPDTEAPLDTAPPEDTEDAADSAEPADTSSPPADSEGPTDSVAPPDTLLLPDTAAPPDTAEPPAATPAPGDLVITELMVDPAAVADTRGEWIELLSLAPHDVDLSGCTLSDGGAQLATIAPTDPTPLGAGAPNAVRVAPGARVVLGPALNPAVNGDVPVDIAYAGLLLPNSGGALVLSCGGAELDRVTYHPDRWVLLPGLALSLSAAAAPDAASNDDPSGWCEATAPYGAGPDRGTPGAPNPACPPRDGDVDRCALVAPTVGEAFEDEPTLATGWLYEAGTTTATSGVDPAYFLRAEAGSGPRGTDPATDPAWRWAPAAPVVGWDDALGGPGQDAYELELTGLAPGDHDVAFRFSLDWGKTWTICDTTPDDATYLAADAGHLAIADSPCAPNPCTTPGPNACDGDALLTYSGPGACTHSGGPASCVYPATPTDCAALGGRCADGACVDTARAPLPGDLTITELLKDPRIVSDTLGEWVELTNTSGASLDLAGCTLRDNATDAFTLPLSPPFVLTSGARVVLGKSTDTAANGGVPVDVAFGGAFNLNNTSDTVVLSCGAAVIDQVAYGTTGWPNTVGASLSLEPKKTAASTNDVATAWCAGVPLYPDAAGSERGTPGAPNHACPEPIDRCRLVAPLALDLLDGEAFTALGQGREEGLTTTTTGPDASPLLRAQAGYGPASSVPADAPAWTWFDATPDAAWTDASSPGADQYVATLAAPLAAGEFDVAFRFSADGGITWTACDRATGVAGEDGSQNGYQTDNAGSIRVTLTTACNPNPCVSPPPGACEGNLLRTFADLGRCALSGAALDVAECAFDATEIDCAALGGLCVDDRCVGTAPAPAPGELAFTEIFHRPAAVSDFFGEWIELEHLGDAPINLAGCTLRDDDGDVHLLAPLGGALLVEPGTHVVLARSADPAVNGGVAADYAWGTAMTLGNHADEVVLVCAGLEVDRVAWGSASGAPFPSAAGAAMQLDPAQADDVSNDDGAAWCAATAPFGAGDLGTPGAANLPCPP